MSLKSNSFVTGCIDYVYVLCCFLLGRMVLHGIGCGLLLPLWRGPSVCVSVGHGREPYRNGRIDRYTVCIGLSMSAAQSTTVHDALLHPHLRHCSSPASAVRRLPSAVRTAVVGPFLWPARRPGTRCQTTCKIRHVPLTVFVRT